MLDLLQLIVQTIYGIVLVVTYLFIIFQILKPSTANKTFKSPFFKIAAVIGFVDLFSYFVSWIMYKLPSCPDTVSIFNNHESFFLFPFFGFSSFYFPIVRSFLMVFSSANRFTALHRFTWHEMIWSNYWKHFVLFCFLISLIVPFPTLFGKVQFIKADAIIAIFVKADWDPFYRGITNAGIIIVATVISFGFNFGAMLSLLATKKLIVSQLKSESHKAEKGLLIISCWDFIIDFIYVVELILVHFGKFSMFNSSMSFLVFVIQIWVIDLTHLSRPIFFIISCGTIRNAFLESIGIRKSKHTNVVAVKAQTTLKSTK